MIDVAVIGAGISGIGAASYLTMKCPNKSFQIIESRKNIGGTWDLFKYPELDQIPICIRWVTLSNHGRKIKPC